MINGCASGRADRLVPRSKITRNSPWRRAHLKDWKPGDKSWRDSGENTEQQPHPPHSEAESRGPWTLLASPLATGSRSFPSQRPFHAKSLGRNSVFPAALFCVGAGRPRLDRIVYLYRGLPRCPTSIVGCEREGRPVCRCRLMLQMLDRSGRLPSPTRPNT